MKLSTAFLLVATAASASAHAVRSPSAKAKLLGKSRRLEDNNNGDDEQQDEEYQFLVNYSLKLMGCAEEQYSNPEDGEYEYHTVVYRMCPTDECDDESATGCKEGYGDFVVGLNSFVEAWLEDKREQMENNGNQDDQWDMNEFAECREYEPDNDADENNGNNNNQVYYVGPTCAEDGTIKTGFFSDYTCTTVPEDVTFEDISNGWSLPYSDGGLITTYCESCYGSNDNGEYELSEMCTNMYMFASKKCETNMETYSQYGKDESGCEYIAESFPDVYASSGGKAGIVIMWIILALLIAGGLFFVYTKWWMKRKQGSSAGLSSSDGVAA